MSKNAHYNNRKSEYGKSPSRKKKNDQHPGQMSQEIDQDLSRITEDKKVDSGHSKSEKNVSKRYWLAFKKFLLASDEFARTYNLYKQVKKDQAVDVKELEKTLKSGNLLPEDQESATKQLAGIMKRQSVLNQYYSGSLELLETMCMVNWQKYKEKFNDLIKNAAKANVAFAFDKEEKKIWMYKFAFKEYTYPSPDSKPQQYDGPNRREFYRTKFVNVALKAINEKGYYEPLSIMDIEKAYAKKREKDKINEKKRNHKTDSS